MSPVYTGGQGGAALLFPLTPSLSHQGRGFVYRYLLSSLRRRESRVFFLAFISSSVIDTKITPPPPPELSFLRKQESSVLCLHEQRIKQRRWIPDY